MDGVDGGDAGTLDAQDALMLALVPDAKAAGSLAQAGAYFAGAHRLAGRQARGHQLALLLFDFGRYAGLPYGIVRQAQEAARRTHLPAPFDLVLDRVEGVRRPGGRWSAAFAGPEQPALATLHRDLGAALERSGLGRHVGLGWRANVPFLDTALAIPATPVAPITWRPTELVLLHRLAQVQRRVVLGRYPFA